MPHIHTQPAQHDLTVSAYIVRTEGTEPQIFLHMHKILKQWMQVGGHVELHETPWTAIKREIKEESGYDITQLLLLQPAQAITDLGDRSVAHPQPFLFATHPYGAEDHYHTDLAFVFAAKENPRHPLSPGESGQLQWFTPNEVKNIPPEQITQNVRVAILYIFEHLLDKWKPVDPQAYR